MNIIWLNELYKYLDDYVSHNLIPNLLQNTKIGKDWNHFMILEIVWDLT